MGRLLRSVWFIAIVVALFFLYFPSLSKFLKLKRQEEGLDRQIAQLELKVKDLEKEAHLMKNEPGHLEQVMRKEMGLVKPGEVVYKVIPEEVKTTGTDETVVQTGAKTPPSN